MIHLTLTPLMSTIRVYDQPDGYEKRLPYLGLVTVKHLTDKTVYLCGAVGKIDRETRTMGLALLREQGITTLMVERHGRMKTIDLRQEQIINHTKGM
jgi:hypothetical protein